LRSADRFAHRRSQKRELIEAARAKGLPVIYTTGERRPDNWDAGSWRWKSTRGDEGSRSVHDGIDGNEIVTMIAPGPAGGFQ
jgi:nicotinamidase-related amidase